MSKGREFPEGARSPWSLLWIATDDMFYGAVVTSCAAMLNSLAASVALACII